MIRSILAFMLAVGVVFGASAQGQKSAYPSRVVKINVGFAAGGGTDVLARYYAKRLSEKLAQPVIVENRPGKGGGIAVQQTVNAPGDGYTLVVGTTGIAVDTALGQNPYDWQRDLTPIALIAEAPNVLVVSEKSKVRSVADLIVMARERRMTFGSAGVTSSMHMTGELFKSMAKVDLTHVPYRGAGLAEQALLSGEIDLIFDNLSGAMAFIEAGRLRPIAVSSKNRYPELPNVPTIGESGLAGFETAGTFFLMAPANVPNEVKLRLEEVMRQIGREEGTIAFVKQMHMTPLQGGGAAVTEFMLAEVAKWKKLVDLRGAAEFGK